MLVSDNKITCVTASGTRIARSCRELLNPVEMAQPKKPALFPLGGRYLELGLTGAEPAMFRVPFGDDELSKAFTCLNEQLWGQWRVFRFRHLGFQGLRPRKASVRCQYFQLVDSEA